MNNMFKKFITFWLLFELCVGKDLRSDLSEAEIDTLVTLHCIDRCIDKKLQSEPNLISPTADKDWYSFSRNADNFDPNGTLTQAATEKAQILCELITTYSLPAWQICAKKCKKFNLIIALSALDYAETYLLTSCSDPERSVYAHKCLNDFRAIEKRSSNYSISMSLSSKQEKEGPQGILCQHYVNLVLHHGDALKECGWNGKTLRAMLNNKLAHSSDFHMVSFTPYEYCNGAVLNL